MQAHIYVYEDVLKSRTRWFIWQTEKCHINMEVGRERLQGTAGSLLEQQWRWPERLKKINEKGK